MILARCEECGRIIDIDELEELPMNTDIGCGLKEGDFMPCEGCAAENNSAECARLRKENRFTKTTISDLVNSI